MKANPRLSALEVIERAGGPCVSQFYYARDLFNAYYSAHTDGRPMSIAEERFNHGFALAAVYAAGKIDGIRQERARRRNTNQRKGKKDS